MPLTNLLAQMHIHSASGLHQECWMRPNCECCDLDLPPEPRPDARLARTSCTFCGRVPEEFSAVVVPLANRRTGARPVRAERPAAAPSGVDEASHRQAGRVPDVTLRAFPAGLGAAFIAMDVLRGPTSGTPRRRCDPSRSRPPVTSGTPLRYSSRLASRLAVLRSVIRCARHRSPFASSIAGHSQRNTGGVTVDPRQ